MKDKKKVEEKEFEESEKVEENEEVVEEKENVEEPTEEEEENKEEPTEEETIIVKGSNLKKKRKSRNIIMLIIDAIIILIVAYFVVGYLNFFKISQEKEPVFEGVTSEYAKDLGIVTVHDYKIYKIVEYEVPNQTITYSMKLWFMEDVK